MDRTTRLIIGVCVGGLLCVGLTGCTAEQPRFEFKHLHQNNYAVFDNRTGDTWLSIHCSFVNEESEEKPDDKVAKVLFLDAVDSLSGSKINYCLKRISPDDVVEGVSR